VIVVVDLNGHGDDLVHVAVAVAVAVAVNAHDRVND
jgi:hypothetical protein